MLVAFDQTKRCYVQANQASRQADYVCSACQAPVKLKQGDIRIAHFAHQQQLACKGVGEAESAMHLMGKYSLWQYFEQRQIPVVLEPWLASIQQRPDLLITYKERIIAIEYQCAPISVSQVQQRTTGYRCLGIQVIWLLGPTYQQRRLQAATWAKFCCIRQDTLQVGFWRENYVDWQSWTDKKYSGEPSQIMKQQLLKIQQLVLQRDKRIQSLQECLYQQARHVIGIPLCCHIPIGLPAGPKEPVWVLTTKLILCIEQGNCTLQALQQFMQEQLWYNMGNTGVSASKRLWLQCVLRYWLQEEMIYQQGSHIMLTTNVCWFINFQTKWAAINAIHHE